MKSLLFIGGFYHLALFVFHLFFWKLFDWKRELSSLKFANRGIVQILNLRLMWVFLVVAYISFVHADALLTTALGRAILISIALFWLMRAVEQIVFFKLTSKISAAFSAIFLLGAAIYFIPFLF
ncbi:MAG: hypothetical protein H0U87_12060 [Acidobacteria bacterium]|jgi:hypothetical protein|nr:hypothetical protein [Acidobacteriota bacterium]